MPVSAALAITAQEQGAQQESSRTFSVPGMSDGFRFDGVFLFAEFVEVFFGLKCGDTAAAGGDDCLTVLRVANVAGGENAFDAGLAAVVFGYDVVFLVQMQMSFNQIRIGVVSDGNEDAVDGDVRRIVGFDVFQPEAGYAERAFRSEDFFDDAVPDNVDFVILSDAFLHGFVCAESVTAVDNRDVFGKIGQIERLFQCGIAAADNGDVAVAVKKAVAGRAGRNALSLEQGFGLKAEVLGLSPRGDNHGVVLDDFPSVDRHLSGALR